MMDLDKMDIYLSRCLKNWAARSHSPREGREQLIQSVVQGEPAPKPATAHWKTYVQESPRYQPLLYSGSWTRASFTLSMAWPIHIMSLMQVAA
jgi:hypothetical protein